MSSIAGQLGVIPACLSFLAIYNPSLSHSDATFRDQIVYYHSRASGTRQGRRRDEGKESNGDHEEINERLRQIGLAQGMVQFAGGFSNEKPIDSIETEKSRVVLQKLEPEWWLLASVELTRLPSAHGSRSSPENIVFEFSAREVALPALLSQQIVRAHQIFLLHQAPSLAELYARIPRANFCNTLERFWDNFIWTWDVLLHGNPAVDIYNGLKLSAGGELGFGVGEEGWGSGEREVLEGFIDKTEGLVDVMVARFNDTNALCQKSKHSSNALATPRSKSSTTANTHGVDDYPGPSDGIIYSGIGTLTRPSIRNISSWMEWLCMHGGEAYGVIDDPSSYPWRKRRRRRDSKAGNTISEPGIPPPIVRNMVQSATSSNSNINYLSSKAAPHKMSPNAASSSEGADIYMKYLTLGIYGSSWGIPAGRPPHPERNFEVRKEGENDKPPESFQTSERSRRSNEQDSSNGYYLIGLLDHLEEEFEGQDAESKARSTTDANIGIERDGTNSRINMRTLHVERIKRPLSSSKAMQDSTHVSEEVFFDRLRVVVYVHKPFIFTLLFEQQADILSLPSFYHSLHHQLGPLRQPLLESTSPSRVSERLWEAAAPRSTTSTANSQPIGDVVYDPVKLTIHSTIPNIPAPRSDSADPSALWTRVEALSVHSQILNTFSFTRQRPTELERTCKTSRGWWVVWMRLPQSESASLPNHSSDCREAFLIRKASDYNPSTVRKPAGRFGREVNASAPSSGWGPGKLAEGIGIDARQYIDTLLSLNR